MKKKQLDKIMNDLEDMTREILEMHYEAATGVFRELPPGEELSPALAVGMTDPNNENGFIMNVCFFDRWDDYKHDLLEEVGANFGEDLHKVWTVAIASEAWMGQAKPDGTYSILPRNDPNRVEVLVVSAMAIKPELTFTRVTKIIRHKDGTRELGEIMTDNTGARDVRVESALLESFWRGYALGFGKALGLPVPERDRKLAVSKIDLTEGTTPQENGWKKHTIDSELKDPESEEFEQLVIDYAYFRAFGEDEARDTAMSKIRQYRGGWEKSHEILVERGFAGWVKDTNELSDDTEGNVPDVLRQFVLSNPDQYAITFYADKVKAFFNGEDEE